MGLWKRTGRFLLGFVLLAIPPTAAQERGIGIGVSLGHLAGLSFKSWQSERRAWAGGVAWSFAEENALHLHLDYLRHSRKVLPQRPFHQVREGQFLTYGGLGMQLELAKDNRMGLRLPLGINYLFQGIPLDAFLEVAPQFDLAPATRLHLKGAIGVRYFPRSSKP